MYTLCRSLAAVVVVLGALGIFGGAASAAPAPGVSQQDQTFLSAAHQANLAEITAAKIAQQKATHQVTKDLAAVWITDHTRLDRDVQSLSRQLGVTLPTAPNAEQQALAARYQQTSGGAFDRLWVSTQIDAHMKAMRLGETELAQGSSPRVKAAARTAAPVIAKHGRLLDQAAPQVGAAPSGVNAGNGVSRSLTSSIFAVGLLAAGLMLLAGSGLALRRRGAGDTAGLH
jgi:putative membrane protein